MHGKKSFGLGAALVWALVLIACSGAAPPPPTEAPGGGSPPAPGGAVASPPVATSAPATSTGEPALVCKLPTPKKSGDPCKTDADCGPSAPCHAPACVAKAKSPPKRADQVCTMSFGCETADANRCGCYEGSCALIPPP